MTYLGKKPYKRQEVMKTTDKYYAFRAQELLASGPLQEIAVDIKNQLNQSAKESISFFNLRNGKQIDLDLSGSESDVRQRYGATETAGGKEDAGSEAAKNPMPKKGRGRPKLGVIGREVTLLPRHWEWLDTQRGGASAALRRLIEESRKAGAADEMIRQSQDSANRFMYAMAGDLPGFEEAVRALYAKDKQVFDQETQAWPLDIRDCSRRYAEAALS
jgi:hypothetical protein